MKNLSLLLLLVPSLSFAFFCPTNFKQIDFGMSKDQVVAQCGAADREETKDQAENVPQEWNYFKQQPPDNYMGANFSNEIQGNLKTQVVLDATGKVVNLSVNGIGVSATTICGTQIQLGMTKDQIKAACGDPAYINKSAQPEGTPAAPPKKITTLYYDKGTPPTKLIFTDNILTSKE